MNIWEINHAIDQFADKDVGRGASLDEAPEFERSFGVTLPDSYKDFLQRYGWARLSHQELYGLGPDVPRHLQLARNTRVERLEMTPPLPPSLVPIMNDGAGNHFCLATDRIVGGECPVVFWDHEMGPAQQPTEVSATFQQWLIEPLKRLRK